MQLLYIAITEIIMDLHQRIDSIKTIVSSLVLSDSAKLVYAIHQVTKEIGISKFPFSATHTVTPSCNAMYVVFLLFSLYSFCGVM